MHDHARQLFERIGAPGLFRVQHRRGLGEQLRRQVMIGDDDVDAALDGLPYRIDAGDPAIDCDDELYVAIGEHAIDDGRLETVAVDQPVWNDVLRVGAEGAQHRLQQDDRRDAVNVVVAIDEDRLAIPHGALDPFASLDDAMDRSRVVQIADRRRYKSPVLLLGRDAPSDDDGAQFVVRDGQERDVPRRCRKVPGVVEHSMEVYVTAETLRLVEKEHRREGAEYA